MEKNIMQTSLGKFSFLIGSIIIIYICLIVVTISLYFFFGVTISPFSIFLPTLISIFIGWLGTNKLFNNDKLKNYLYLNLFLMIIFALSLVTSSYFYDLSYDGQSYHQEAIIQLANGWNPVYSRIENSLWLNHYAKGPWLCSAAIYKVTNNIELGKAVNILLIFASFFLSLSAILTLGKINLRTAISLSILLALNPVSICQSLSFYVDGQLSSLIIVFISAAYLFYIHRKKTNALLLTSVIILIVNIKFTALIYSMIFSLGFLITFIYTKEFFTNIFIVFISLIVGIFIVGYNPYITNFLQKGHPFYPLAGQGKVDIMTLSYPKDFKNINRCQKLFVSLFSKSTNDRENKLEYKIPFTIDKNELIPFTSPDIRIAGFGPLFGGITILTLLMLVICLFSDFHKTTIVIAIISIIIASILSNPESWWSRYAPQLWIIPLLCIILALHIPNVRLLYYLSRIILIVLFINIFLITGIHCVSQLLINIKLKKQFKMISNLSKPIEVDFNDSRSNRIRLDKWGIKYTEVDKPLDTKSILLKRSQTSIWIVEDERGVP